MLQVYLKKRLPERVGEICMRTDSLSFRRGPALTSRTGAWILRGAKLEKAPCYLDHHVPQSNGSRGNLHYVTDSMHVLCISVWQTLAM
jgi:hypothetical protein